MNPDKDLLENVLAFRYSNTHGPLQMTMLLIGSIQLQSKGIYTVHV
jgi:hypothetical protein